MANVRCPYRGEGNEFKIMAAHLDGRYVWGKCGQS